MKKFLLLAAVAISAMSANAQALQPMAKMQKVKMAKVNAVSKERFTRSTTSGPKKLLADDCYYLRPEGSFVYGFDKDGNGFYNCYNIVTPYKEVKLTNAITQSPASAIWTWGGEAIPESYGVVDEDNNFVIETEGAGGYYMPGIKKGGTEYIWGYTDNWLIKKAGKDFESVMISEAEISPLRANDPHIGNDYIGWGFLSTDFLFGDGQVESTTEGVYDMQCFSVWQEFEKPMSPLYVEDIWVSVEKWGDGNFLPEGKELTMEILNENGEVIYTLTCTRDEVAVDAEPIVDPTYPADLYTGTATFTMKEIDPLSGGVAAVPFVLDEAFTVTISGFEGTGIGFNGHVCSAEEAVVAYPAYNVVYEIANPDNVDGYTYQSTLSLPLTFSALLDNAMPWETAVTQTGETLTDFNVLQISADGQTIQNVGYPDYKFVFVNTACSWFDEDENEMYYLADAVDEVPSWIYYGVDNSGWTDYDPATEGPDPTVYVGVVECEALPAGVTGRGAKIYVYGRGMHSAEPIYILQGDYTKAKCDADEEAAGVNSVIAPKKYDGKTYNIAGQSVKQDFKGIVIKDGKKYLNK